MKDKTILITGATSGIGKATAIDLAHRGAQLIIVGRNIDTAETTKYEITQYTGNDRIHAYYADMSLVGEVINLCHQIKNTFKKIDVLINNVGMLGFPRRTLTLEKIEATFATNFLSHATMSLQLVDLIKKGTNPQIITTSSIMHKRVMVNWNDIQSVKNYRSLRAYGISKLFTTTFSMIL